MEKSNIVVISPHPDDLEIAMGGTVAKFINNGYNIVSIVVTDGRGSTNLLKLSEDELAEKRKKEVQLSSEILGIGDLVCFGLRDVKTDSNKHQLEKLLADTFKKFSPKQVYLPHYQIDKHKTHRTVSDITIKTFSGMDELSFENTEFWFYEVWTPFSGYDRIEDISDYVLMKTDAINAHQSQLEYKNYTQGILGLNRYRAVFNDIYENEDEGFAEVFIKYTPQ